MALKADGGVELGMGKKGADIENDHTFINNAVITLGEGIEIAKAFAALGDDGLNIGVDEGFGGMCIEIVGERSGFLLKKEEGMGRVDVVKDAQFVDEGDGRGKRRGRKEAGLKRDALECKGSALL